MPKVIADFEIIGTIDDLNFYKCGGENLVRQKGKSGVTSEGFKKNPIFDRIRMHSSEFGRCSTQSKIFRLLVKDFFDKAKEGSFAGRVNQLLFEIMQEDTEHALGERQLASGLSTVDGKELLLGFEANKLRKLPAVLRRAVVFDWSTRELVLEDLDLIQDINWPEPEANLVHFQLAIANWDYETNAFENQYSEVVGFELSDSKVHLSLQTAPLITSHLWMAFIFIGFAYKERKKVKPLHKRWNTACCIGVR